MADFNESGILSGGEPDNPGGVLDNTGDPSGLLGSPLPGASQSADNPMNVDTANMSSEELVAFVTANPEAAKNRMAMQAQSTQNYQEAKRIQDETAARERQLQSDMANVQAAQAQVIAPEPVSDPTTILEQMRTASPAEFATILKEFVDERVAEKTGDFSTQVGDLRTKQVMDEVNRGFLTLAQTYGEVNNPDIRTRVEQEMIRLQTREPQVAYLSLAAPKLAAQQAARNQQAIAAREAVPVPGASQAGPLGDIEGIGEMTIKERTERAQVFADSLPDSAFDVNGSSDDDIAAVAPPAVAPAPPQ